MVDEGNFLALQFVNATFFLADVLHQHVGRAPVSAPEREVVLEHLAVHRVRAAVTSGDDWYLVGKRFVGQRKGDTGRQRMYHRRASRALAFETLVALHPAIGGVAGFTLLEGDLDATDAAIARIEHLEVVDLAVGERHAIGRIRAGTVRQHREKLFLCLGVRRGHHGRG